MANLGIFNINTYGQWATLADITELTFTEGEKYLLQVNKGGIIQTCEKGEEPDTNEGFTFMGTQLDTIPYEVGSTDLYIKNLTENTTLNIAIKE